MKAETLALILLLAAGCGGSDVLTGPGEPLELSDESLEGRWVLMTSVYTMESNPAVEVRFEHTDKTGPILEFDGEGGVSYLRLPPDGTPGPPTYTISGNRLILAFDYGAEVSTTRLELTLEDISFDFDQDGMPEPAINVTTYQKYKD